MALDTNYVMNYLAGVNIPAGTTKTTAQLTAIAAGAKVFQVMNDGGVRIAINGSDGVHFPKGSSLFITAAYNWTFANNCEIALCVAVSAV